MARLIESLRNPETQTEIKVYYDWGNNEYRVKLFIDNVWKMKADYFTDDQDDAIGTAHLMLKEELSRKNPQP